MHFKQVQLVINFIRRKIDSLIYMDNEDFELAAVKDKFNENCDYVHVKKNSFYDAYMNNDSLLCHKWEQYMHIYNKHLQPFKSENKPVNILEIGVFKGGSLELWNRYLPENSKIIGIDINPDCKNIEFHNKNIQVFTGSASDKNFIEENFKNHYFDIIIDDGSHISSDVITAFEAFFPKLNPGGLYIIEDLHTSYWSSYGGDFLSKKSSIEYLKRLIDSLNFKYIPKFKKNLPLDYIRQLSTLNKELASITFYDSVCILEKYMCKKSRAFKNYLSGEGAADSDLGMLCNKDTKFERFFR